MVNDDLDDMLTVEEAAAILSIGRTAAYRLARRYLETAGEEGLPVKRVGRLLRVPRALFEECLGTPLTRTRRPGAGRARRAEVAPAPRIEQTPAVPHRRGRRAPTSQSGLPFSG